MILYIQKLDLHTYQQVLHEDGHDQDKDDPQAVSSEREKQNTGDAVEERISLKLPNHHCHSLHQRVMQLRKWPCLGLHVRKIVITLLRES